MGVQQRFKFKLEGKEYILQIYRPLGGGELFLPFKDKTSETETYRMGRYLNIEPMPGGKVLIDFNRAYNPFCQYNEKYTCPFAPGENWLGIELGTPDAVNVTRSVVPLTKLTDT